jgi:hypothetical protein
VAPVHPALPVAPAASTCPPAATVTVTIVANTGALPTVAPPASCKSCFEVHTLTLTNGQTSVITITHQPTGSAKPTQSAKPTKTSSTPVGTGSVPTGTGAVGTGNIKWHKRSATPKAW